jgi:hypothetical protein
MKHSLIPLFILCLSSLGHAQQPDQRFAPVAPFVDSQTLLVAHADLQRLDLAADDNKLLTLFLTAHRRDLDADAAGNAARDDMAAARRWRDDVFKSGGRNIYAVASLNDIVHRPFFLVVTHEKGADAATLRALLTNGRAVRPWSPQSAESVNDTTIVAGSKEQLERVKTMKPAPRPDLASAAATLPPDAPFALLVIPSPDVRKAAEGLLPPLPRAFGPDAARTLSRGLILASLGTDLSPKTPITLTIQSEDPAAANAMADFLRTGLAELVRHIPDKPAAAALPQFKVTGDRVVTALDHATTESFLSQTIAPALRADRIRAERVKSASNMRQILQGLMLHANDHKGTWPDDIRELTKTVDLSEKSLQQPYRSAKGGYVYIKPPVLPTELRRADKTIVVYEQNPVPPLINVAFADGHVEAFPISTFEKLLKEQQEQARSE